MTNLKLEIISKNIEKLPGHELIRTEDLNVKRVNHNIFML